MEFHAVKPAGGHQSSRLGDGLRTAMRVEAGRSEGNIGVALAKSATWSLETTGLRDKVSSTEKTMHAILRDR